MGILVYMKPYSKLAQSFHRGLRQEHSAGGGRGWVGGTRREPKVQGLSAVVHLGWNLYFPVVPKLF